MNTRGATVILVYNGGAAQCYIFVSKPRVHLFMLLYNGYMNRNNVHDSIGRIINCVNICYDSEVKFFPTPSAFQNLHILVMWTHIPRAIISVILCLCSVI